MGLRYLLAGVPASPYFRAQRCCVRFIFRTNHVASLRTAVATAAMQDPSACSISTISAIGRNYLSAWFRVTKRLCTGTPSCGRAAPARLHSTSSTVAKDVVLFEHDRTRFFRLLSFFCAGQLLFWTYLAHFAFTNLRDPRRAPAAENTAIAGGLFGVNANLGSSAWRYGFTLSCLAVGGMIVGIGVLFCRRSVCRVILHRGGGMVTVTTQSPLGAGRGRSLTVPLEQVACVAHRQESPSFVPLRVKGHRFYFLLDMEGIFNNPKLFDVTVGAYRPF